MGILESMSSVPGPESEDNRGLDQKQELNQENELGVSETMGTETDKEGFADEFDKIYMGTGWSALKEDSETLVALEAGDNVRLSKELIDLLESVQVHFGSDEGESRKIAAEILNERLDRQTGLDEAA